jgi:hypothetical protein
MTLADLVDIRAHLMNRWESALKLRKFERFMGKIPVPVVKRRELFPVLLSRACDPYRKRSAPSYDAKSIIFF